MTDEQAQPPDEAYRDMFRDMERALWLLTAFRADNAAPRDNDWFKGELQRLMSGAESSDNPGAEIGRLVNGFLYLSSLLVDDLVLRTDRSSGELLGEFRRRIENAIAGIHD